MRASWTERAACREPGVDAELFFPLAESPLAESPLAESPLAGSGLTGSGLTESGPAGSGLAARQVATARAICARCPVTTQCREWAVRAGEPAGIWGGTTPDERRLLRARRDDASALAYAKDLKSFHFLTNCGAANRQAEPPRGITCTGVIDPPRES
jgi:hypothetical protein